MKDFKPGDFVGLHDTYLVVLEVGEKIRCWDALFDFEVSLPPEKLYGPSELSLDDLCGRNKYGAITIRELLEKAKREHYDQLQLSL